MRVIWILLFLLALAPGARATTLDEIIQLSKLNTSDDLIIQLIQKSPLKVSVASADVVYLKAQGVSEPVITYIWTTAKSEKTDLPPQEGESINLGEGVRAYYVHTEDGQKKLVITNLDENGMRMGPLPPLPTAKADYQPETQQPAPVQYSSNYEPAPQNTYYEPPMQQPMDNYNNYYPTGGSYSNSYYPSSYYYPAYYTVPYYSYYSPYFYSGMRYGHNGFHSFPSGNHNFPGNSKNCPPSRPGSGNHSGSHGPKH